MLLQSASLQLALVLSLALFLIWTKQNSESIEHAALRCKTSRRKMSTLEISNRQSRKQFNKHCQSNRQWDKQFVDNSISNPIDNPISNPRSNPRANTISRQSNMICDSINNSIDKPVTKQNCPWQEMPGIGAPDIACPGIRCWAEDSGGVGGTLGSTHHPD